MPQHSRRKPFSGKQKTAQLQRKRDVQRFREDDEEPAKEKLEIRSDSPSDSDKNAETLVTSKRAMIVDKFEPKFEEGGAVAETRRQDRYKLMFAQESASEIEERKRESRQPLQTLAEKDLEVSYEDIYGSIEHIDMPVRPTWQYSLSKQQLEAKEQRYFNEYIDQLMADTHNHPLSYFERNPESWRQLWRVLEMSNVIVIIADARHPILHFPPSLYRHVVHELNKTLVLVLNKIDLVPASVVLAWREYFYGLFPQLHVVLYTARPGNQSSSQRSDAKGLMSHARCGAKRRMICVQGARQLIRALANVVADHSTLSGWTDKLSKFEVCDDAGITAASVHEEIVPHSRRGKHTAYSSNGTNGGTEATAAATASSPPSFITIGLVGHPNVGKSSILNSLIGKQVVSASRTPGHTKHFQTHFLTPHIRLCDSPGLVFPSRVEKQLQILSGMCPISQVHEPYTSVGYLAVRLGCNLLYRLGLAKKTSETCPTVPPQSDACVDSSTNPPCNGHASSSSLRCDGHTWSAWDVCEKWVEERGFRTAKGARPDTYRAGNHILRLATDGRIALFVRPPKSTEDLSKWMCHPEIKSVVAVQLDALDHDELSLNLLAQLSASSNSSAAASSADDSSCRGVASRAVAAAPATRNPFAGLAVADSE
ncbi:guanine nucleotide-binding protein-like 1 [Sycon ciliatum]|uniref:guanine nucleotide-binding protein-like 1 n=1 Tax=Sycon ciliatum TaxID=27933 RepID=UPI0031F63E1C